MTRRESAGVNLSVGIALRKKNHKLRDAHNKPEDSTVGQALKKLYELLEEGGNIVYTSSSMNTIRIKKGSRCIAILIKRFKNLFIEESLRFILIVIIFLFLIGHWSLMNHKDFSLFSFGHSSLMFIEEEGATGHYRSMT